MRIVHFVTYSDRSREHHGLAVWINRGVFEVIGSRMVTVIADGLIYPCLYWHRFFFFLFVRQMVVVTTRCKGGRPHTCKAQNKEPKQDSIDIFTL